MTAPTAPRAQIPRLQPLANRLVRGLLRTPVISKGIGKRLVTIRVVGRKSGRRFDVPVAYTREGDHLLVGTPFGWGRNLRTGEPVDIWLEGKLRRADVEAFSDEPHVVELYTTMCQDNHHFAQFNKIGFDGDGNLNANDLHEAWAAGARAFRLTPH